MLRCDGQMLQPFLHIKIREKPKAVREEEEAAKRPVKVEKKEMKKSKEREELARKNERDRVRAMPCHAGACDWGWNFGTSLAFGVLFHPHSYLLRYVCC